MKSMKTRFLLLLGLLAVLVVVNAALTAERGVLGVVMAGASLLLLGAVLHRFRVTVSRRLAAMAAHIEELAARTESSWISPVSVQGDDEISALGRSFNRLLEKVHNEYASLEGHIAQRTAELQHANERLYAELDHRRKSEDALRESDRTYRLLIDNATDMITRHLPDSTIIYTTPACERMLGYKPEDMVGHPAGDFVAPGDMDGIWEAIQDSQRRGDDRYRAEFRMIRHDGSVLWVETQGRFIFDAQGSVTEIHSVVRDISERKKAEEALRTSESFLGSIIDQSPFPMWISDEKGILLRINNACRDMLHLSDDEVIGRYNILEDNIVEEQGFLPLVKRVFEEGDTVRFEIRYDSSQLRSLAVQRSASVILDVTVFPIRDAQGRITNAVVQHRDITGLKQAEEALKASEEKFSKVFRASPVAITVTGLNDGLLIDVNEAFETLLGYTKEEVIGHTAGELKIWADPKDRECLIQKLAGGETVNDQEARFRTKDGRVVITRYSAEVVEIGGETCLLSLFVDITGRKLTEEKLRESNRRLEDIIEFLPDATFIIDKEKRIVAWNRALEELTGTRAEDMVGKGDYEYAIPFYHERRPILIDLVLRPDPDMENKYTLVKREGDVLYAEMDLASLNRYLWGKTSPIYDEAGRITGAIETIHDLTKRRKTETALMESEERYRSLFENAIEGIFQTSLDGRLLMCNISLARMLGYDSPQDVRERVTDIGAQIYADPEERRALIGRLLREGKVTGSEILFRRTDGSPLKVMLNFHLARDREGNPLHIEGSCIDITARWMAEQAVKESEKRIREIIDNAPFGAHSYRLEADGRLIFTGGNPAADRILGHDHYSLFGKRIEEAFPMLEKTGIPDNYREVALTGKRWEQEVVLYEDKDITGAFEVFAFQTGPGRMTAFFHDITGRKKAEKALRESEELLRATFNATADGILVVDGRGKISQMNQRFIEMWRIPHELQGSREDEKLLAYVLDQLEDPDGFLAKVRDLYQSSREDLDEIRFKDGRVFERYSCPVIMEGKETGRIWDFRDITVRTHALDDLRSSEARYRRLHNSMMDAFVRVDLDGNIVECNESYLTMLGYDAGEIRGLTYQDITPEKWHTFESKIIEKEVLVRGYSDIYEKEYRRRDGTVFPVEMRTYLLTDDKERPTGMWAIVRDITERKQAEERLREANRRFENIIEFLPDATLITDSENRVIAWNRAMEEMTGIPKGEMLGKDHFEAMVPFYGAAGPYLVDFIGRDDSEILSRYKNIRRKGETIYAEVFTPALYIGRGAFIWAIASPLYNSEGKVIGAIESIRDITDRKRVEEALQAWMRRYDLIVEASGQVAYEYLVPTGEITWGKSIEKVLGYPPDEFKGGFAQWKELLHPEDLQATLDSLGTAEKDCAFWDAQYRMRHRLGHYVWIRDRGFFLPGADGRAHNQLGMMEDITEQKHAEEELRKSEEKYRVIFEGAVEGIFQTMPDGRYATVNPAFARILGFDSPDELISGTFNIARQFYVHPEERTRLAGILEEKGRVEGFEVELKRNDGSEIWVSINVHTVQDPDGNLLYYEGTCEDITKRRQAEEALQESEGIFRAMFNQSYHLMGLMNPEGVILKANSTALDLAGASEDEVVGKAFWDTPWWSHSRHEQEKLRDAIRKSARGELVRFVTTHCDSGGNLHYIDFSLKPVKDEEGKVVLVIPEGRDITERVVMEEALRESESRYRLLAENASDIIFTMDNDLRFTYISPSVERIRGYAVEEAIAQRPDDILTPASLEAAEKVFREELEIEGQESKELQRSRTLELEERCKDGSAIWTETTFTTLRDEDERLIGFLGITRDITERRKATEERKRLEMQLTQAQKMESIGTLAGGIAHDFNNILAAIIGYTELAIDDMTEPEKVKRELREVLKAGDRARDLVGQILTFSRKTDITYSPLALRTVIKESLKMLRSVIPTTVEIRQDIADSGLVLSDPTQIHQIVMNLCTNAAHAMDRTGGVLEVGLKKVHLDQDTARDLDVNPGSYLRLTIADTGHGMPLEVLDRIFEPYFTTKDLGRGTGLGLSVVHGIVKSHQGAIVCRSALGEGTTFEVYLPEIETEMKAAAPVRREPLPTGSERILFVDDEPTLTGLAEKMLSKLGYRVAVRSSSVEALDMFREGPDQFDLVITDMTMPVMTGDRLAQKILEIHPDIPIILCTGYSEHITEERAKVIGIREFLLKPIEMGELAKTVRKVLDMGK